MGCCSDRLESSHKKENSNTSTEPEMDEDTSSSTTHTKKISKKQKKCLKHLIAPSRSLRRIKSHRVQSENFQSKSSQNDILGKAKNFIKIPIRENYTTIKILHHGSNGDVSLVIDKRTGLKQVIKEVKKSSIPLELQEKFILETQKFLSLDHPNIVKLKEVYESSKSWNLVYEYLSGGSLLEKVSNERIGYSLACSIIRDILSGLNYCHLNRIYHLGLSLGKVIQNTREGKFNKIIGFISPWELENRVNANEIVNCYMAPEIIDGDFTQPASDVWSLGVMLYSIVQGKPPFRGKTLNDLKLEYKRGIDLEENYWIFTSSEFDDLLRKMLEYDHKKRITVKDALNHPWINNNQPLASTLENKAAIKNFRKFVCKNKIAREFFIKAVFVNQNDNYQLIELYKSLDTDKDEKIGKEEFLSETKKIDTNKQAKLEWALSSSDFFEKGYIGYSEFIAACTDWNIEENLKKVGKVLNNCELTESRQINVRSLKASFEGISHKDWKNFFGVVDSDQSGTISLGELKTFLFGENQSTINSVLTKSNTIP